MMMMLNQSNTSVDAGTGSFLRSATRSSNNSSSSSSSSSTRYGTRQKQLQTQQWASSSQMDTTGDLTTITQGSDEDEADAEEGGGVNDCSSNSNNKTPYSYAKRRRQGGMHPSSSPKLEFAAHGREDKVCGGIQCICLMPVARYFAVAFVPTVRAYIIFSLVSLF
jgi:hypothetical protein